MIELQPGAPDGVIVMKAVGTLTADDYDDVLEPAVADLLKTHDGLRVVIVLGPEWEGMSAGAVRVARHRAVAAMRDCLEGRGPA